MVRHYSLTLTGSVQNLGALESSGSAAPAYTFLSLQQASGNSGVTYVGGTGGAQPLTTSNYGFRLEIPVTSIPPAPSVVEVGFGRVVLSEWSVLGTNNDVLHILVKT